MKVYVIEFNNGEPYEDNMSWIDGFVFMDIEEAKDRLIREEYEPSPPERRVYSDEIEWERNFDDPHYTPMFAIIRELVLVE